MAEGQVVGVLRLALALLALAQEDRVAISGERAESLHQVTTQVQSFQAFVRVDDSIHNRTPASGRSHRRVFFVSFASRGIFVFRDNRQPEAR